MRWRGRQSNYSYVCTWRNMLNFSLAIIYTWRPTIRIRPFLNVIQKVCPKSFFFLDDRFSSKKVHYFSDGNFHPKRRFWTSHSKRRKRFFFPKIFLDEFFLIDFLDNVKERPKHNQAVNTVIFQMQRASLFHVRSRSEVRCVIHIIFRWWVCVCYELR